MSEWISVDDRLPLVGSEVLYIKWIGWCNEHDEAIYRLMHGEPSKMSVKYGIVLEVGNEGAGNYVRINIESPDHVAFWMPLPEPPKESK